MDKNYILKEHCVSSEKLMGLEKPWNLKRVKKGMSVSVVKCNKEEIEFDLVGVSPAIANAFRRILLSEVPSMAIEKVMIYNNTSLLQDEILAHRLGLIPLKADPRLFEYKSESDSEPTDQDTLQFELKIKCSRNSIATPESTNLDDLFINHNVYSKHITWIPLGGQADLYKPEDVGPVHHDILIDKLRPGHELDIKLLAVKGIGRDHAKFSPVATATYRLHPEIEIVTEVEGDSAVKLQSCFSPGVIGIRESNGKRIAFVKNARYDACSRNVFRHNELKDCVRMGRRKNHYIFTIESVGALSPNDLFLEAIKCLRNKCRMFMEQLNNID